MHSAYPCNLTINLSGLAPDDVLQFTPKFRQAHTDGIILRDIAAQSAFSVHYNLVGGTIASLAPKRPDLQPLLKQIFDFDVVYVTSQ